MIYVLEAGLFAKAYEGASGEPGFYAGYDFRLYGRAMIEKRGVSDDGCVWAQQAIIEGGVGEMLQDWVIVEYRDRRDDGDWTWWLEGEGDPFVASVEEQDVVALAVRRAKDQLDAVRFAAL